MASIPTAPLAAGSLIGGYLAARVTKRRPLGGVVLAAGGVACTRQWVRGAGTGRAAALLATYLAAFGLSHPLARRIGAWPAVLSVAAVSAAAAWLVADHRR
jgi:hypothetical protein